MIPSTASRWTPIRYDRRAYNERNLIERTFCRRKDFPRVANPAATSSPANFFLAGALTAQP